MKEIAHATSGRVLRLAVGDEVSLFNGEGPEWSATIGAMTKSTATLHIGESHEAKTESALKIHLVQGISRGERMDFVVQKATELGVKRISPVLTEYGVVKLDAARAEKRRDHWQSVAASACEQSGRTRVPLIDAPMSLKDWVWKQTDRGRRRIDSYTRRNNIACEHSPAADQGMCTHRSRGGLQPSRVRRRRDHWLYGCVIGPASTTYRNRCSGDSDRHAVALG